MKTIFKVALMLLLMFLSSCFNKETNELNNKIVSKKTEKNIVGSKDNINTKVIDKLDIKKIEKIQLSNAYIKSNKEKKVSLNNLILREDAILFLKGKCNLLKGNGKEYDNGNLIDINEEFNLKNEYFSGLEDYKKGKEYLDEKKKLENIFNGKFSKKDLLIVNSNSAEEIIKLLSINNENLAYSLEKYSLLLNLSKKKFENKKNLFNEIFKKVNKSDLIDENYLTGILYYYYSENKECDGFFKYILNEFNK